MRRIFLLTLALGTLVSCGRETADVNTKLVGVGRHPDDIGPSAKNYGGFIDYSWLDFAGAGLSLGAAGFSLYDEISPGNNTFKPPYAVVSGQGFIFDEKVPAPDAAHGNIGVPPELLDSCWTDYEPFSLLAASPVDAGAWVRFRTEGGSTSFEMERYPAVYPPDPQDVVTYYIGVSPWRAQPLTGWKAGSSNSTQEMTENVITPVNFTGNSRTYFEFPGGISPMEAPVGSIPLPSAHSAPEGPALTTPGFPGGVMLSWDGPAYDSTGSEVEGSEGGSHATCMRYFGGGEAPESAEDCQGRATLPNLGPSDDVEIPGQIYTGPWTSEEGVTFRWTHTDTEDEEGGVLLNVRFLARVDRESDSFSDAFVAVAASQSVEDEWSEQVGKGNVEGELPTGYRPALACDADQDIEYRMDPTLIEGTAQDSDNNVTSLRGDPSYNLVEVSCRLKDDGEFTLTQDHLAEAIVYANAKNADGSMFYFGRFTQAEMSIPDVKDQAGHRREVSPILLKSHAVKIGRFWFEPDSADGGQE